MKNEIIKVKQVKAIPEKLKMCFEISIEKKTKEHVVGTFKNTVNRWYKKDAFAGFCQQIFEKKNFRRHFNGLAT